MSAQTAHRFISPGESPAVTAKVLSPWFVRFSTVTQPSSMQLFCFPYAGGSATIYRNWPTLIDPRIELLGVQLPGRGVRLGEPPREDFEALVAELSEAVRQCAGGRRFAFFGHSMGALLMFEVARRLALQGAPQPHIVFASGRPAPHIPCEPVISGGMSDDDFIEKLRCLDGTPRVVLDNAELLALLMPTIRADFALLHSWRLRPSLPLGMPLVGFAGNRDVHVSVQAVQAWESWTKRDFELLVYPGGHFFVHERERQVARDVSARLLANISPDNM